MEINFENLKKINLILEKIEILENKISSEKRWLNSDQAANYLGYSKDHIHRLKDNYLIENKHYYKKAGKVLFDKLELDNWVTTNLTIKDLKSITDNILKAIV